ncbi:uncharacterized protein LOC110703389 [Chenopodium quinoa]|uniref:uncharacterized protein LOC110703389 n=1 Tax=Chenopodium quinoa TaxID=63459 RepID=UPI000B76FB8E|nr:uncharacterized protein LOC110703389 [Chenopodium quinoa]XP_021736884.1 uncharacterized protein LOC110703389 [Chenopodium quinoa]
MVAMQEDKYARPLVSFVRQGLGPSFITEGWDSQGTQLFELLAVRVHMRPIKEVTAMSSLSHLEVYGRIVLIDELGNKFYLFKRRKSKAKSVFLHNDALDSTVILHNFDLESPRCLPSKFCLKFHLKDKHQNIVIVKDCKLIDCTQGVTYDRIHTFCFRREQKSEQDSHCLPSVSVDYAIFRCALLACVSIELVDTATRIEGRNNTTDESDFVPAKVFGRITSTTETSDMTCIRRLLFDETDKLFFEASNKLSTFSVPSYSLLEIQVNVEVEGERFCDTVKFKPYSCFGGPYCVNIHGKSCRIRVFAHFGHARDILSEYPMYEYYDGKRMSNERSEDKRINRKRSRGLTIQKANQQAQLLEALNNIEWYVSESKDWIEMMEIFSISIFSYGVDGLRSGVKGKILVSDEYQEFIIFDGCKESDILHSHETSLKLKGSPRCYTGEDLSIILRLEDGKGRNICSGSAWYNFTNVGLFLNTRICSIVCGIHGFAALHYTIFSDAIQAKLRFTLMASGSSCGNYKVYGRINTRYSNFRYLTHYEKKYYESSLFEKGESEVEEVTLGEIPLSKSVVAVPLNASLIVLANLCVLCDGGRLETLEYKQTFEPEKPKSMYDEFQGSNYCLRVYVDWTRFPPYDPRYCSFIDT